MHEQPFLTIFQKTKFLKNPTLMLLRVGASGPQTSFSWKWVTGILNQAEGKKGLLKWGIYISATPCKTLATIKKQQKHIDWGPTDPSP